MAHPHYDRDEVARRGDELYDRSIRPQVETDENIGKIVSIDILSGDYEVGDDVLGTSRRLQARRPDAVLWTKRIGYDAVYAIGGTLTRTVP